jgi:hypothetical protein
MAFLIAAVLGFAFGGADQYFGSLIALAPWSASVSQMSAPWLILAFVAGTTQARARTAVLLATTAIVFALLGYFALTLSPFEGVALSRFPADWLSLVGSNGAVIIGGLVTAPLFGLLGNRWRTSRSPWSAAAVAGALCLEPLARLSTGRLPAPSAVWLIEVTLGLLAAAYFITHRTRQIA